MDAHLLGHLGAGIVEGEAGVQVASLLQHAVAHQIGQSEAPVSGPHHHDVLLGGGGVEAAVAVGGVEVETALVLDLGQPMGGLPHHPALGQGGQSVGQNALGLVVEYEVLQVGLLAEGGLVVLAQALTLQLQGGRQVGFFLAAGAQDGAGGELAGHDLLGAGDLLDGAEGHELVQAQAALVAGVGLVEFAEQQGLGHGDEGAAVKALHGAP
jgi:hypothetical protein